MTSWHDTETWPRRWIVVAFAAEFLGAVLLASNGRYAAAAVLAAYAAVSVVTTVALFMTHRSGDGDFL